MMCITAGDIIGVFYNTPSGLQCGGYSTLVSGNNAIAAWGTDANMNNGFAAYEPFKWKLWRNWQGM